MPDGQAALRSQALAARILAEIDKAEIRAIPFERFMELALYAPGLGYYQSETPKFGEAGDFITAPESSPLFSRCLARQAHQALTIQGGGDIMEVGAGSGVMAAGIMAELHGGDAPPSPQRYLPLPRPYLPGRYLIVEKSPALRHLQRTVIHERVPALEDRFHWPDVSLPPRGFRGVILANELLDAIPACRFTMAGDAVEECWVGREGDGFIQRAAPARPGVEAAVRHVEKTLGERLPDGYTSEVHPARTAWVGHIMERLEAGLVLLLDYGYPRNEYYHPERQSGTLTCHYRHGAHDDPFFFPGLQDISVHVDFTAIAEAAMAAGGEEITLAGFTTQRDFLFSTGLLEMCAGFGPESREYLRIAQGVKTLTLPGEMGDTVKAMAFTRGITGPLMGFGGRDLRGRL